MEGVLTGSLGLKPLAGKPPTKREWGRGLPALWCCWLGPSRSCAQTPSITSWIRVFSHRTDTWGQEGARQNGSSQDPARVPSSAPHRVPPACPCMLAALDTELGPWALCLSDKVSVPQEENQGRAAGPEGGSKQQESTPGARADQHREVGPESQARSSAWVAPLHPPHLAQPYQFPGGAGTWANSR